MSEENKIARLTQKTVDLNYDWSGDSKLLILSLSLFLCHSIIYINIYMYYILQKIKLAFPISFFFYI